MILAGDLGKGGGHQDDFGAPVHQGPEQLREPEVVADGQADGPGLLRQGDGHDVLARENIVRFPEADLAGDVDVKEVQLAVAAQDLAARGPGAARCCRPCRCPGPAPGWCPAGGRSAVAGPDARKACTRGPSRAWAWATMAAGGPRPRKYSGRAMSRAPRAAAWSMSRWARSQLACQVAGALHLDDGGPHGWGLHKVQMS